MEKDAEAYYDEGVELFYSGKHEEALEAYKTALHLDDKYVYAWNEKGNSLNELGRYEEALEAFKTALDLDDKFIHALNGKGNSLNELGRYEEALEAYKTALDLDEKYVSAWNGKGNALNKLGLDRNKEALEAFETALRLDDKFIHAWHGKGNTLSILGRYEEALKVYDTAIQLDDKFAYPWYGKAQVYDKQEDFLRLKPCLLRAYKLSDERVFLKALKVFMPLCEKFSAPLFFYRVTAEHPFLTSSLSWFALAEDILEKYAPSISRIYELKSSEDLEEKKRAGMFAYYLGDPIVSHEIFDEIDNIDDTDLWSQYYLTISLHGFMEDARPELEFAVKQIHKVVKKGRNTASQFYYAGMIFRLNEDFPAAKKAFEKALKKESEFSLPALYMKMLCAHCLKESEEMDSVAKDILKKEYLRYREGDYSFLKPLDNFPDKDSPEWAEHSEKLARGLEISEALNVLYQWLDDYEFDEDHSLAEPWDFVDRNPDNDPEVAYHSWMISTKEKLEEFRKRSAEKHKEELRPKFKPLLLNFDLADWTRGTESNNEISIAQGIENAGEKIKTSGEAYESLIRHCFLEGFLSPETTTVLLVFVQFKSVIYRKDMKKFFDDNDESIRQSLAYSISLLPGASVMSRIAIFLGIYKISAAIYDSVRTGGWKGNIEDNLKNYETFKSSFAEIVISRKTKIKEELEDAVK